MNVAPRARLETESEPSYLMTNRRMPLRTLQLLLLSTAIFIFGVVKTRAGGPVVWETDSRAQLLSRRGRQGRAPLRRGRAGRDGARRGARRRALRRHFARRQGLPHHFRRQGGGL